MGKTVRESANGVIQYLIKIKKRSGTTGLFKSEINEFVSEHYRTSQRTTSGIYQLVSNSATNMDGKKKRLRSLFWVSKDRVTSNQIVFYDSTGSATNPVYVLQKEDGTTQPFSVYKDNMKGFWFSQHIYMKPRACSLTNWVGIGFILDPNEP